MAGERDAVYVGFDTNTGDNDQNIDALISGWKWNDATSNVVTYSFPNSEDDIGYALSGTFSGSLNGMQRSAARDSLDLIDGYTKLTFEQMGDDPGEDNAEGTIRYFEVTGIGTAWGFTPNDFESGGDTAYLAGEYETPEIGEYEYATFLHETGHAMGLRHGSEPGGPGAMNSNKDSMEYSVMTYRSFEGQNLNELPFYTNEDGSFAQTYMMYDIAAMQRLYGANFQTNKTDSVYTFDPATGEMFINGVGQGTPSSNVVFRTVWDGNGVDTYDLSNYDNKLMIDLRPGKYSDFDVGGNEQRAKLNFGIGYDEGYVFGEEYEEYAEGHLYNALLFEGDDRSYIENAIGGSKSDKIIGNAVDNKLEGKGAGDTLLGKGGNDKLLGQAGRDTLKGDNGKDVLKGGGGGDTINGGKGKDTLIGGGGDDEFVFKDGFGTDTVKDWDKGDDTIRLSGLVGTRAEAKALAVQDGADTRLDFGGGDVLILKNTDASTLTLSDFEIA